MPRSQYSGSGVARSALLCLAVLEFVLIENIVFGLLLGGESALAMLAFVLQLPHLVTLVACVVVVFYHRRARGIATLLMVAYAVAFVCDILGVVAHAIFAYNANDSYDLRRHALFSSIIFLLVLVDALGAHFVSGLRTCYADESATIESFGTPTP